MKHYKGDVILQGLALRECKCPDTLKMIRRHAPSFRAIITSFAVERGRLPTVNELLWIESEAVHHNIREED